MKRLKNSIGIWGLGPNATRFMPGGYHPEAKEQSTVEWTTRAVDGLGPLLDGLEYHYPGELNEENLEQVRACLGHVDIYCLALGLFSNPRYSLGSFINPDKEIRSETVRIACQGVDLAAKIGAKFIIWPGGEGYNYPFQVNPVNSWNWFIEGIAGVVEHAASKGVTVLLEHKNSEPAMRILMRDIGMTMFVIKKVNECGVDVSRLKINMDWQHLIMNGEPLAEYAALLCAEGLLGHHHGNSGWGSFDDDNMVGALCFMETLALCKELQLRNYGANGERIGFDLFPYTEDQVAALRRSILQWEFIWEIAERIDTERLRSAQAKSDAVAAYTEVFNALGLDEGFERRILEKRQAELK
ncbi:MAG: TIM barrel protein [Deltaproteobacteria bacterium]|nr:MAG: TIM barrel protein [Deltaproteobacteria bacterium]